jgi:5-methylcytosine-specific restriction endonuclease McrA
MSAELTIEFWAPRRCLLEPIREIFDAAKLLDAAVDAHHASDPVRAARLILEADSPAVARWTQSIWGPQDQRVIRFRDVPNAPPEVPKNMRARPRAPSAATRQAVVARDGWRCRFCGIPVIDAKMRRKIAAAYPQALRWNDSEDAEQHSAFQCMRLQYDHVLPHTRGGTSSPDNLIVTCAPCNYGRWFYTLEEVGLIDPRTVPIQQSSWDGLERFAR